MNKKIIALAISSSIFSTHLFAATDEVLVTGSYQPTSISNLTSSATVITQTDLARLSNNSLVDALRQVPSIWVEEQGGPGGITAISLRGAESNHTLVLIDGVQVNDPTNTRGGAFDLNNLGIESVERIEIIRGAQSGVYGSDALAGVINIITVNPTSKNTQHVALTGGSNNYQSAMIAATGTLDDVGYAIKVQTRDAGEPLKGSSAAQNEAMVKLHWQNNIQSVNFSYRFANGDKTSFPEQSGGPLYAKSDKLDESDFTDQNLLAGWSYQVTSSWKTALEGTWYNRDENSASPGILPYSEIPPNGAELQFTRESLRWNNTLGNEKTVWANIGADTKREDGQSRGYIDAGEKIPTDFALDRTINGAFINANVYVNPDLLLQYTGRVDKVIDGHTYNTSQVGFKLQVTDYVSVFANRNEGFKLPSFFALGHPMVGDMNLKPETSETFDAGINWKSGQWDIEFTTFENHYKNLIDFNPEEFKNVNRPPINMHGAELEVRWASVDTHWNVAGHINYADVDAPTPLLGRPISSAGASINYSPNSNWRFTLNDLWVSNRLASSLYSGDSNLYTLDSYNKVSATVQWQAAHWLNLSLSGDNLTNSDSQSDVGFPGIERSAYLKAVLSF